MKRKSRFLRTGGIAKLFELSQSTIHRLAGEPDFPRPVTLGNQRRWLYEDIVKYARQRGLVLPSEEAVQA